MAVLCSGMLLSSSSAVRIGENGSEPRYCSYRCHCSADNSRLSTIVACAGDESYGTDVGGVFYVFADMVGAAATLLPIADLLKFKFV